MQNRAIFVLFLESHDPKIFHILQSKKCYLPFYNKKSASFDSH